MPPRLDQMWHPRAGCRRRKTPRRGPILVAEMRPRPVVFCPNWTLKMTNTAGEAGADRHEHGNAHRGVSVLTVFFCARRT